jgi:hypothetical protein
MRVIAAIPGIVLMVCALSALFATHPQNGTNETCIAATTDPNYKCPKSSFEQAPFVAAVEGDAKVPDGTQTCHGVDDPKLASQGLVSCTDNLWTQHYIRCEDTSRVLLTAENGKHWCMAVQP